MLAACSAEEPTTGMQGALVIRLVEAASETGETRGTPSELEKPLAANFALKITNQETAQMRYNGLFSGFKMPAYLNTASYTLEASYGENPLYGFDTPFYRGARTDVEITSTKETVVQIQCELANALASVTYTNQPLFDKLFSTYAIEAKIGDQRVAWDPMDQTNLYFSEKIAVELFLKGTKRIDGTSFTLPLDVIERSVAKTNYRYDLTAENTNANETFFDILIDRTVEEVTIAETLPEAWLPKPKITTEGFENSICTVVETVESTPAKLLIKAAKPIEDITFTLAFGDPNLQALNKTYTVSTLTVADRLLLTNAGIDLPELEAKEGILDFTRLTNTLITMDGGSTVDNKITLSAKANSRWSDAYALTLQTVKPIFKPTYYPGNIWTKQFQASPLRAQDVERGDLEKLKTGSIYEWSVDGITWNAMPESFEVKKLTPNTSYYMRALYRDIISEVVALKTYQETALANGELETYKIVKGKDGDKWKGYGAQFEWNAWATLNALTTPKCTWTAYAYNTRSGTRPVDRASAGGAKAVWICTIGHGYGGTNSSPKTVTPGELFLGVYNTKGINYASRPTGVRFWYKYAPYDGDKSDIKIEILNGTTVLGSGVLQQAETVGAYAEHVITVTYDEQYKHLTPEKISLVFKSGYNTAYAKRESGGLTSANTANPMFRGSELFIDDVSLVYEK